MRLIAKTVVLAVFLVMTVFFGDLVFAEEGKESKKKPSQGKQQAEQTKISPDTATAPAPEADVKGFRSAHFGMTEKDVEKAIARDFPQAAGKIQRIANPVEKTTTLLVTVDNLLPDSSSTAQVGYILGHKSQALIQVNVLWGKPAGLKSDNATLVAIANELKNYFVAQGFEKDKMIVNAPLPDDSVVVFRGNDKKGHMVLLLLNAVKQEAKEKEEKKEEKKEEVDLILRLSYFENPTSPDIFQIKQGDF